MFLVMSFFVSYALERAGRRGVSSENPPICRAEPLRYPIHRVEDERTTSCTSQPDGSRTLWSIETALKGFNRVEPESEKCMQRSGKAH